MKKQAGIGQERKGSCEVTHTKAHLVNHVNYTTEKKKEEKETYTPQDMNAIMFLAETLSRKDSGQQSQGYFLSCRRSLQQAGETERLSIVIALLAYRPYPASPDSCSCEYAPWSLWKIKEALTRQGERRKKW